MKVILIIFFTLLGLFILLLLALAFAFPLTQVTKADIQINLGNPQGQSLPNVAVEIWEYDHATQRSVTNDQGIVEFKDQSFLFSKSFLQFWKKKPDVFSIRLRTPEIDKLYYRFEVKGFGSVPYEVFSDSYDYFFGEKWLGTFNEKTQTHHQIKEMSETYTAVEPPNDCKCVPLWNAKSSITPISDRHFNIQLNLQQSGTWKFSGK